MRWLAVSVVALTAFCDVLAQLPSFCDLPKDPGPGNEVVVLLYYNKAEDRCNPFHYGGQGGNENRFLSDRMCMGNCSSRAAEVYPADEKEACHLLKDYGHCMSRQLRWYYNTFRGKCKGFHYTGCGGNGNRFISERLCNTTCTGITDDNRNDDNDDTDTPIGLIIGIVLGILGAIIITVTIVVAVKYKKPDTKETKKAQKEVSPLKVEGIEMT